MEARPLQPLHHDAARRHEDDRDRDARLDEPRPLLNADTLTIPPRFNGPPASANGGYACGLLAALVDGTAEVTLRSPPPLGRPLAVERAGRRVLVRDGDTLVAEAEPAEVELDLPAPVPVEDARAASERFPGFEAHAYATCFVCGPAREDGLAIYPGPVDGRDLVAAAWTPEPGPVPDEIVWAALDCPSGWAIDTFGREGVLLGRLAGRILAPARGGEAHVVLGWPLGAEGRRRLAGSAILRAGGEPVAVARSTWIVPRAA